MSRKPCWTNEHMPCHAQCRLPATGSRAVARRRIHRCRPHAAYRDGQRFGRVATPVTGAPTPEAACDVPTSRSISASARRRELGNGRRILPAVAALCDGAVGWFDRIKGACAGCCCWGCRDARSG
jgi:hypothetical protein